MTFCDKTVEIDFGHTEDGGRKTEDGWTDKRGTRNSYLDEFHLLS